MKNVRPSAKPLPLPEAPPAALASRPQNSRAVNAPIPLAAPAAAPPPPPPFAQQSQQMDRRQEVQARDSLGSLAAQTPVSIRGTVTDPTGAVVPSANIVVKSLLDGSVVNTNTNERGEFSAAEIPGNAYEISASKEGFQTARVKDTPPMEGAPAPVNLKLNVGSAAQTVEVAADSSTVPLEARKAAVRAGFGGAVAGVMKAAVSPACQLLRIVPGSGPVPVPQGGTVPTGSSLVLQVTPVADGYMQIVEGKRTIANPRVTQGVTADTPLPAFDKPGRVELKVYLSPGAAELKKQQAALTIVFRVQ